MIFAHELRHLAIVDQLDRHGDVVIDRLRRERGRKAHSREYRSVCVRVGLRPIETNPRQREAETIDDPVHVAVGERIEEQIASGEPLHIGLVRQLGEHGRFGNLGLHRTRKLQIRKPRARQREKVELERRCRLRRDARQRLEQLRIELHRGRRNGHADRAVGLRPIETRERARRERHRRFGQLQHLLRERVRAAGKILGHDEIIHDLAHRRRRVSEGNALHGRKAQGCERDDLRHHAHAEIEDHRGLPLEDRIRELLDLRQELAGLDRQTLVEERSDRRSGRIGMDHADDVEPLAQRGDGARVRAVYRVAHIEVLADDDNRRPRGQTLRPFG